MSFLEPASAGPSRLLVDSYQPGLFRIGGALHAGPTIVWPGGAQPWALPAGTPDDRPFAAEDFAAALAIRPAIEVLIVGCGTRTRLLPAAIRLHLRAAGIGVDAMATGAACRTYNVLVTEMRRVAAALIPL